MRQPRPRRPAAGVPSRVLARLLLLVSLALACWASGGPGALAAPGGDPPEGAPPFDPEAHARDAAARAPEAAGGEPVAALLEVRRIRLPWPPWVEVLGDGGAWSYAAHRRRGRFIVETDPATLEVRRAFPYHDEEDPEWEPSGLAVLDPPAGPPLLVATASRSSRVRVWEVGEVVAERDALDGFDRDTRVAPVGDGESVLLWTSSRLRLVHPGSGSMQDFPRGRHRWTLAGPRGHRLLLHQRRSTTPGLGTWLALWDLSDPRQPRMLVSRRSPVEELVSWLLAGDGSFGAWVEQQDLRREPVVHVIEIASGREVSRVEGPPGTRARLSDTAAGRYLLFLAPGLAESWSLDDPAAPRKVARRSLDACAPSGACSRELPVLSPGEPALFAVDWMDRAVTALDARTLDELARWRAPGGELPVAITLHEARDGARRVVVNLQRQVSEGAIPGTSAQASIDWTDPWTPREDAHHVLVEPLDEERAFTVAGGRYLVAWHPDQNTLTVIDAATGEVSGREGLHGARSSSHWWHLAGGGHRIVLGEPWTGAQVFDLVDGVPSWRGSFPWLPEPGAEERGLAVRQDGLVAILYDRGLQLVLPDGSAGPSIPLTGRHREAAFSPDGRQLLAWGNTAWAAPVSMTLIDVSDPATPVVRWSRDDVGGHAAFVRGGEAIATLEPAWGVQVSLLDAATGERLGPASEEVPAWFYFGGAATFGEGPEERATWWKWTWAGWRSLVFDVSRDAPELVLESPEYHGGPQWVTLADRSGLREVHGSWGPAWRDLWVYRPDGTIEEAGQVAFRGRFLALRRGFMAGGDSRDPAGYTVWRDPAMNRPPVARAGEDRVLECAGPGGTAATLDGSGTRDPDSTPGTNDDLAALRWDEGGSRLCEGMTCEAVFPVGRHVVTLSAEDVLGAIGTDDVVVTVTDTEPPAVEFTVTPRVEQAEDRVVFTGTWVAEGSVTDVCDGELGPPLVVLLEEPAVLSAPWRYEPAERETVEVRRGAGGLEVILRGPSEARVLEHWRAAMERGGWQVQVGWPTSYWSGRHVPAPGAPGVVEELALGPCGKVLEAVRYAEGADFVLEARGADAAGNEARAAVSLAQQVAAACAELPPGVRCAR